MMQLLPGVGPAAAQRALDYMMETADPIEALGLAPAPPRAGDDWLSFVATIRQLGSRTAGWPSELELVRLWYEPHLDRMHEDAVTRRVDLIQLEQIASGYPSRERFLTELTLDPPDATSDLAGFRCLTRIISSCRRSTRPRARNGNPCSCSTSLMAAFRLISQPAPRRRLRKSAGFSMWQ